MWLNESLVNVWGWQHQAPTYKCDKLKLREQRRLCLIVMERAAWVSPNVLLPPNGQLCLCSQMGVSVNVKSGFDAAHFTTWGYCRVLSWQCVSSNIKKSWRAFSSWQYTRPQINLRSRSLVHRAAVLFTSTMESAELHDWGTAWFCVSSPPRIDYSFEEVPKVCAKTQSN